MKGMQAIPSWPSAGERWEFLNDFEREEDRWICNLKEGDLFGEFGFFTDQKRHATVKAAAECEILEISRNALNEIIRTHPRIREVLSGLFEKRVLDLFVSASPLFSSLSSAEREEVFKRFRLQNVPRETLVFQGGDPPGSLYMIQAWSSRDLYPETRRGQDCSGHPGKRRFLWRDRTSLQHPEDGLGQNDPGF